MAAWCSLIMNQALKSGCKSQQPRTLVEESLRGCLTHTHSHTHIHTHTHARAHTHTHTERERDLLEAEVAVAAVAGSRRVGHGMQTGLKPSSGRNTGHSFPRQQELVCSFQRARVLGGHLKLATPRLCMHLHQAHPHSLQAVRNRVQHCTDRALLGDCASKRMAWPHWRHHDPYQ